MDHPLQSLSVRTGCVLSLSHHIPGRRALGEEGISLSFIVTVFCLVVLDYLLCVSIWLSMCGNVKESIRSSETGASSLQHLQGSFPGCEKHCSYPGKKAACCRVLSEECCLLNNHVLNYVFLYPMNID